MVVGKRWDIFCKVIDNYGDIGVAWRLARQLAHEFDLEVCLWLDDLQPLTRMWPAVDAAAAVQHVAGVEIRQWRAADVPAVNADVVIEAFACHLPEPSLPALAAREPRSVWLNLEYLSAEDWVNDCHGLPSIHPHLPLTKYFFFPGFTGRTGGLLRERDLLAERAAFQHDAAARAALLDELGVQLPIGARLFSLFSYDSPAIGEWLDQLAAGPAPTVCVVPEGRALPDVAKWSARELQPGASVQRGALTVHVLPFLPQDQYDRLLWACDFNLVRGEDSFVRAQWAGRPFAWHIYQQGDAAHQIKLAAFYALYGQGLPASLAAALHAFSLAWSTGHGAGAAWAELEAQWPQWQQAAMAWSEAQNQRADLATQLVAFCDAHR